jgi:uncharacterized membrane protein YdjX (TVP38/TMEM64 family)
LLRHLRYETMTLRVVRRGRKGRKFMSSDDATDGVSATVAAPPDRVRQAAWRKIAGFCVLLGVLVGGTFLVILAGQRVGTVSGEAVAAYVKSWGIWGHFGLVGLMVVHSFVPFPAELVAIAAGMCFGAVWGTILTWIGAMVGALLAFGLSRKLGRPFVADLLAPKQMARIDNWSSATGISALIVVRLIPVIAFNLVNYAAGITRVSWWRFTWTTALGILPMTVLMAVLGEQMREPTLSDWLMLLAAGVLILLVVHVARRHGAGAASN